MSSLDTIGRKTGTDKSSAHHDYLHVYESYLNQYRHEPISLIELGVGGYQFADRGGESARMWYEYLTAAKIITVDIYPKDNIINDRVEFWQGSQTDAHLLNTILDREAHAVRRVVIDDASHNNQLTIASFHLIFPKLQSGDLYFIEDVHTSYWENEEYEGKRWPGEPVTTMWFFTTLCHQLNAHAFESKHHNEFTGQIEFMHFYKELIVIKKL